MNGEFYEPLANLSPGAIGRGSCESPLAHMTKKKAVAEEYAARRISGIQQSLESNELDNVYWPLGPDNPSDGFTRYKSGAGPLLRLLKSGPSCPVVLRPLRGVSSRKGGGASCVFFGSLPAF